MILKRTSMAAIGSIKFISILIQRQNVSFGQNCLGGEQEMDALTSQIAAVVIFGVLIVVLPSVINKWSDSRSGVR